MPIFKVWLHVERVDESADEYTEIQEPEELGSFETAPEAVAFAANVAQLAQAGIQIDEPGASKASEEGADVYPCSDCNHPVHESDPYFGTPCGTYCSHCMEKKGGHAAHCSVCASEFDLQAEEEPKEQP